MARFWTRSAMDDLVGRWRVKAMLHRGEKEKRAASGLRASPRVYDHSRATTLSQRPISPGVDETRLYLSCPLAESSFSVDTLANSAHPDTFELIEPVYKLYGGLPENFPVISVQVIAFNMISGQNTPTWLRQGP